MSQRLENARASCGSCFSQGLDRSSFEKRIKAKTSFVRTADYGRLFCNCAEEEKKREILI